MKKFIYYLLIALIFTGCATLRDLANIQKPALEYSSMSVQSINFSEAVLLFDFEVDNPNPVGITASGYTYDFLVNNNSFLSGSQDKDVKIGASNESVLQVPVTLQYSELYDTFNSLLRSSAFDYDLNTEFLFEIPGLGQQSLPVSASGSLPVPKIPRFGFAGYNINQISASGADMDLIISVTNPNQFPVSLLNAEYILDVNGREWLNTSLGDAVRISAKEQSEIIIPVQLNAVQMGAVLFDMMRGSTEFNYNLKGNASVGAEIEGFSFTESIFFDREGEFSR